MGVRHETRTAELSTRSVLLLVIISLLGAMLATPVQVASGFVPSTFSAAAGDGMTHQATLTHSLIGGSEPKQDETFTYTGTFNLSKMTEAGVSRTTTITVTTSQYAPFTSDVVAADFKWSNGAAVTQTPNISCNAARTSCTITYTDLPSNTLVFTKSAKVVATAPPGSPFTATCQLTPSRLRL